MAKGGSAIVRGVLERIDEDEEPTGQTIDQATDAERAAEDQQVDEITKLLEMESGLDTRWKVTRIAPLKEEGVGGVFSSSELTIEAIMAMGPGVYRIQGIRPTGKKRYAGMTTITIADSPQVRAAVAAARAAERDRGGTMLVPGFPTPDAYAAYLRQQQAGAPGMSDFMKQLLLAALPLAVPVAGKLIERIFERAPQTSITELVTSLAAMKKLSEPDDGLKQVEKLGALISAVRDLAPTDDKPATGSTWADIARDGLNAIGPMLQTLAQRGAGAPQGAGAPRGAGASAPQNGQPQQQGGPSPNTPPAGEQQVPDLLQYVRSQVPFLLRQAAGNRDPDLYAELLVDQIPENVDLTPLVDFLSNPAWFDQLAAVEPSVRPYQPWFTQLGEGIVQLLTQPEEGGEPAQEGEHIPAEGSEAPAATTPPKMAGPRR